MPNIRRLFVVVTVCFLASIFVKTTFATNQPSLSNSTAMAGIGSCPMFPADNAWNRDVSNDPIDPNSDNYIASINAATSNGQYTFLRPAFGLLPEYGIPYAVVSGTQPKVPITFT